MSLTERTAIATAASTGLRAFASERSANPALIGFDGFVDSIIDVVEKREDTHAYDAVPTIARFAEKVAAAAGQSANYEFVTKLQKLGGNGPIMANALASVGLPITYIGTLGYPTMHPVFEEFAARATVITIAEPGYTDALEFTDGKLMLGKLDSLKHATGGRIRDLVGPDRLRDLLRDARLIGTVNWTMLPYMKDIWAELKSILAEFTNDAFRRRLFVDLADPEKRKDDDLREALTFLTEVQTAVDVTLGLNLKEAVQVAQVLGVPIDGDPESQIETIARDLRETLALSTVVVHPRAGAAGATLVDGQVRSATFRGPFVQKPKLSTGAGDNFNAGFCLGQLADLPIDQALCVGTATSGFYVRNAKSPTLTELANFCEQLPPPEGA